MMQRGDQPPENGLDPISLEIMWQRLISIMNEVDDKIVKTTFSTILSEGRDFACILTDTYGRSLCQSAFSTATFSAVYPRTAKALLERFPIETLRPGDVIATNDPWLGTGHLPDYVLLAPVFVAGRVIACVGTVSHMSDVGGHPGEIESDDVFSEGLCMPPFKLYDAGVENELAFDVIGANCRAPELLLGDLRAMAGAARVASDRFTEYVDDYGLTDLEAIADEIVRRSERYMRSRISALPDGSYTYGMEIDGYIETVHLQACVTIAGDTIHVDYEGTSPQSPHGSINSSYNSTLASSMYVFKCALASDVPNNEALFTPIRVTAPEGSILNARFPAPVKARAKTINNLNQVLFGALWPVLGDHVQASNGGIWPLVLKGREAGRSYLVDMLPHGGRGALPGMDGMLPVSYPENSTITPCEVIETRAPIRFHRKALRLDTGAPGRHRGGVGQSIVFEHVGAEAMTFSLTPDRITTSPQGLAGGHHAARGTVRINGEAVYRFPAITLRPGDVVSLDIAGGGGFGDPAERQPDRIERDIADGLVTREAARRDYGFGAQGAEPEPEA
ncbi:MAG: hydantoinase B/oxoprolinase family protein [Trueperaceae bacterium]|nr:MAG: hydantoinase B/oxoprolinase family protein [Trueperaceae bacterium]